LKKYPLANFEDFELKINSCLVVLGALGVLVVQMLFFFDSQ
jgi:hypothetical protein